MPHQGQDRGRRDHVAGPDDADELGDLAVPAIDAITTTRDNFVERIMGVVLGFFYLETLHGSIFTVSFTIQSVITRRVTMAAPLMLVILMSPFLTGSVGARVHRWPGMQYLHHSSTPRVVFVTSIFGTYEKTLKEPVRQTVPAHFLAFTDREDLNSSGWQVRRLPDIVQTFQALLSQDEIIGPNKLTEDSSTFMKVRHGHRRSSLYVSATNCRGRGNPI